MLGEGEDAEASEGRALPGSSPSVTAVSAVSTAAPSSAAPQPAASNNHQGRQRRFSLALWPVLPRRLLTCEVSVTFQVATLPSWTTWGPWWGLICRHGTSG